MADIPAGFDCTPWECAAVGALTLATISVAEVERLLPSVGWQSPRTAVPSSYAEHLTTRPRVNALYDAKPWSVLVNALPVPITFDHEDPRFSGLVSVYESFIERWAQALWERHHALVISADASDHDPAFPSWFRAHKLGLKNRVSHIKKLWRVMLKVLVDLMRNGDCDLDVLLDPYFYLLSPTRSDWYPQDLGPRSDGSPSTLENALAFADRVDPWRNHFIEALGDHPSAAPAIRSRIAGKFVPRVSLV